MESGANREALKRSSGLSRDKSCFILLQVYGTCRPDQNSLNLGPGPGCARGNIPDDIEPGTELKVLVLDSIEQLADVDLDGMAGLRRRKIVKER